VSLKRKVQSSTQKMSTAKSKLPPGIRHNNPGNLKQTNPRTRWRGQVSDIALKQNVYEEYLTPEDGMRAMIRDLLVKHERGLDTVEKIIEVYAPRNVDNNQTDAYINDVCQRMSKLLQRVIYDDTRLDLDDYNTAHALVRAMVRHENGPPPGADWYRDGVYVEALRRNNLTRSTKQIVTQSTTIKTAGFAGVGGSVLGTTAVVDAVNQAKDAVSPGTLLYVVLTLIVVSCTLYIIYERYRRAKIESQ